MSYKTTIGLEVHAELKTQTKMFCNSKNDTNEPRPNVNICPICMGHPGTLPVINKEAVKHVLTVGIAVGGELADYTEFDRKNYFYPDIPKGYQISQYKYPLVAGGSLNGITLTRIHLEEDTAKSFHKKNYSLIDFNRAGIPLMELVTEPVIKTAEEASRFAKELQLLLRYLGVSEANMEKGEMRVEANISISKDGKLGTKVEVKNINSFRSVERAITFEMERQEKVLEKGGRVIQETRGWDENKQKTVSQRIKEGAADYRYFPDPDLPHLRLSNIIDFKIDTLKKELPELPWEKRERYKLSFGIKDTDVEFFVQNKVFGDLFEKVVSRLGGDKMLGKLAANYIVSDLRGINGIESGEIIDIADNFAELIQMLHRGDISSRGAKDILAIMILEGGSPQDIAAKLNILQKSGATELEEVALRIIKENPEVAENYKQGNENVLQFLVGQGMKATKGSANPQVLADVFKNLLK